MTYTAKKNMDILLPLIAACAVGYWFFMKYGSKKWQTLIVLVGLTFLAVYIATTRITKSLYEAAPTKAKLPYDLDTSGCNAYDTTAVITAVYDDGQKWFFRSNAPYEQLATLSDCQLVKASNDWLGKYYQTADSKTLRAYIAGQPSGFGSFAQLQSTIDDRFTKLNIS